MSSPPVEASPGVVEVPVPRMFRYQKRNDDLDGVSQREVRARVKAAERLAGTAVLRAAKAASLAGIAYTAPEGVNVALRESDLKGRETVEAVEARLARLRQELEDMEGEASELAARRRQLAEQHSEEAEQAGEGLAAARRAAELARRDAEAAAEQLKMLEPGPRRQAPSAFASHGAQEGFKHWDPRHHQGMMGAEAREEEREGEEEREPGTRLPRTASTGSRMMRNSTLDALMPQASVGRSSRPLPLPQAATPPLPAKSRAKPQRTRLLSSILSSPPPPSAPSPESRAFIDPKRSPLLASISPHPPSAAPEAPPSRPPPRAPSAPRTGRGPAKKLVTMRDLTPALQGRVLQLYWPDDSTWWVGQVLAVDPPRGVVHVLYDTGEEEAELDIQELIERGEVAWAPPGMGMTEGGVFAAAAAAAAAARGAPVAAPSAPPAPAPPIPNKRKSTPLTTPPSFPMPKRPRPTPTSGNPSSPPNPHSSRPQGAPKQASKPPATRQRPPSGPQAAPLSPSKGSKKAGGSRAEVISLEKLLRMGREAVNRFVEVYCPYQREWKKAGVTGVGRHSVDLQYLEDGDDAGDTLETPTDSDVMLRLLAR